MVVRNQIFLKQSKSVCKEFGRESQMQQVIEDSMSEQQIIEEDISAKIIIDNILFVLSMESQSTV
jgi:hypothetical protein